MYIYFHKYTVYTICTIYNTYIYYIFHILHKQHIYTFTYDIDKSIYIKTMAL